MVTRNHARRPAERATPLRNLPPPLPQVGVFTLNGRKQPPAFSAGVAFALDAIRGIDGTWSESGSVAVASRMHGPIRAALARRDSFADGVLATLLEYMVDTSTCGSVNLDVWLPLNADCLGDNSEIPPEDSMFYDVAGVPYSVDPNLRTLRWNDETGSTACNVESIRGNAKPITRARFDVMRWEAGTRKRASGDREAA